MSSDTARRTHVIVECSVNEPALIPAAFDLMRTYARAYDLPDVEDIDITMHIEFGGRLSDVMLSDFKHQLDHLWFGRVEKVLTKEPKPETT